MAFPLAQVVTALVVGGTIASEAAFSPHSRRESGPEAADRYALAMATVSMRPARTDDAGPIADIWWSGWQDGHLGNVPAELVAARSAASFRERANARVAELTVAEVDGRVAGFVLVSGDEVEQVYVDSAHRGKGVAPVALAEAERLVASAGYDRAWLAVATGNARARRFYERQGWIDEGDFDYEARVETGTITVACRRYVKTIG